MKKYLLLIFIIFIYSNVIASEPQIKSFITQSDFNKGEAKGISITSKGELQLAPDLKEICNTNEPVVWDLICDANEKIFFSAGNEGKIYTIDKTGAPKLFCQLNEIEVYTLTFDDKNTLYAGTSPDGKVYHISKDGTPTVFYDPPDKYIWDLLFDKENNLYIATGDTGIIYKISPNGDSAIFYGSDEPQIRCLAWDQNGDLLAGSFGNGYIYRIDKKGNAFVIYDSEYKEIHQIEVDKDKTIYAAALGQRTISTLPPLPRPENLKESEDMEEDSVQDDIVIGEIKIEAPRVQPSREIPIESAILKINPNGVINNIWDSFNEPVQTIILESNGILLTGTGKTGKLVRITPDGEKTILLGLDESQINVFCKNNKGELLFATSNMGKICQLLSTYQKEGYYISEASDSYTKSKWGSISWEQGIPKGCVVKFFTRSGNTKEPNSTWSNWSSGYTNHEGENISTPDARYLQWKLQLSTKDNNISAKVSKVNISYLQKNLPPEIQLITIYAPGEYYQGAQINIDIDASTTDEGIGFEKSTSKSKSSKRNQYVGRKSYRKGYRTVGWNVTDDNNDNLIYQLYYREQSDRNWKRLAKNWQNIMFSWDTERLPDGIYSIKLIASDSLSNPNNLMLYAEKISETFQIDNTGPQISNILIENRSKISFTINDQFNPIKEAYYSIDGEEWKLVYPLDNICDSKTEKFIVTISSPQNEGTHTVVIKALDTINNIGFGRKSF